MHAKYGSNPHAPNESYVRKQDFGGLRRASRIPSLSLLSIALYLGCLPSLAAPTVLPALMTPMSQEHHVGKVIFVELMTPDIAATKQFYGGLLGWQFRDINTGGIEYTEASLDGRVVAGLIHRAMSTGEHHQPAWLEFISVNDVDAATKSAVQQGAKVLYGPHTLPDRGREAVLADPQGAVFAILASSSGDPADELAAPGEWIWSSLITTDPDSSAAFYQALFNYEVFDLPTDDANQHLLLATDNYSRASTNSLPSTTPNARPHWLNYVRVDDASKTVAKLLTLGGHVLVEPRIDRHGGKIAVVTDPQGAPFGLLEWTTNDSKEANQ